MRAELESLNAKQCLSFERINEALATRAPFVDTAAQPHLVRFHAEEGPRGIVEEARRGVGPKAETESKA